MPTCKEGGWIAQKLDLRMGVLRGVMLLFCSSQPHRPTWACGIIHVLGQLNFLSDPASQPYMTMAEVAAGFGVGQSTASAVTFPGSCEANARKTAV
jgi:hypothetical protein